MVVVVVMLVWLGILGEFVLDLLQWCEPKLILCVVCTASNTVALNSRRLLGYNGMLPIGRHGYSRGGTLGACTNMIDTLHAGTALVWAGAAGILDGNFHSDDQSGMRNLILAELSDGMGQRL